MSGTGGNRLKRKGNDYGKVRYAARPCNQQYVRALIRGPEESGPNGISPGRPFPWGENGFPLLGTRAGYNWDMSKLRRSKRRAGVRLIATLLLAGFLLLTAGPVCGSTSDVDPQACCERHGCHQSARDKVLSRSASGSKTACATCDKSSCSTGNSAEDCCRRAALAYPVARAQSASNASALVLAVAVLTIPTWTSLSSAESVDGPFGSASPPPKLGCVALYALHSVFRI